ncbi:hypothetical protein M911_11000 [Ectothiorhodospira haloalkaliphila]|uniref:Uncharacterized protein n=1 Tax=Ectothiorhodospira haloalkaliphila TaxID=421628 RepID=W8KYU9_9GAMM|nr:hypothetical protein M911_11000 [Ectothiorhodospira haloalkaliphila]
MGFQRGAAGPQPESRVKSSRDYAHLKGVAMMLSCLLGEKLPGCLENVAVRFNLRAQGCGRQCQCAQGQARQD